MEKFDLFVIETSETVEAAEAAFRRIAKNAAGGILQLEVSTGPIFLPVNSTSFKTIT